MTRQHSGTAPVPLSPAVLAGDFISVSGQVPVGPDGVVVAGGIAARTRTVMADRDAALKLAGADLSHVIKTLVILVDARDFGRFSTVYAIFFSKNPPARTTADARLMIAIRVEIEAVADKPL